MRYRAETTSVAGFVQQIACCYLRHGYWFYVCGRIPSDKEPRAVDAKLIAKYGIDASESTRTRRKRAGLANLQYIRHGRFFVLMATKGQHGFFEAERNQIRDIRRVPLKYGGYSISYRRGGRTRDGKPDTKWHAHVEIERSRYLGLKAELLELARYQSPKSLALRFYELAYEPYAPVRRQTLNLLRSVNRARKIASKAAIPSEVLPLRRRVVQPFAERR
jgi:hypothetical protein